MFIVINSQLINILFLEIDWTILYVIIERFDKIERKISG